MACPAILTGESFLASSLAHLDCQGRVIGAYGYGALADPASGTSALLISLLTIFIALWGIRLLLGAGVGARDVVGDALRVGIVLTLALSWPAWRVVAYDVVTQGPGELAGLVNSSSGLAPAGILAQRLQNADDGLIALTTFGTGRLTGGVVGNSDRGDSFHGVAIGDETGLGWGRIFFLVGSLAPYAVLRVGAGLLLAIAPLMAGLLLFGQTVGLFIGWMRALAFVFLGGIAWYLTEGVKLAMLAPWISDALARRDDKLFTPSMPTELVVMALAFCVLSLGIMALIARLAFLPHGALARFETALLPQAWGGPRSRQPQAVNIDSPSLLGPDAMSRVQVLSGAMDNAMRREEAGGFLAQVREREAARVQASGDAVAHLASRAEATGESLGSSFRRTQRRTSAAGVKRDRQA